MKVLLPAAGALAVLLLSACGSGGAGGAPSAPDVLLVGEMRISSGDTIFMPCGTQRRLRITGPGLDSLARRYTWLQTGPGQWIKAWCNGHLTAVPGSADSLLVAASYVHMDAAVHCPPVPLDTLAGRYVARAAMPGGEHLEQLDLLRGGDAVITTTMPGVDAEVDGTWGLNSDGQLIFEEAGKKFAFRYTLNDGGLVRHLPNGRTVEYVRTGPPERLSGAFGRTARWLAAVSNAHGRGMQAGELRPTMRLDSLFPDPATRDVLRKSARDTLAMDEQHLNAAWHDAATVRDVVQLMRGRTRFR
ncbi:MAG TPA: hypothetical protein PLV70_04240 [Flavobacteriales bacterium]|nr:hypothetical protein [Flavobacteriales bacterium]HRO40230.1 hypothetical protein [Flavobacteriales bacterium]HRP82399.1 hypothetical protein [Flavobacteriales bacterium]HRQ84302.1 hypothetical protein [Flavobacteriales bacterium]